MYYDFNGIKKIFSAKQLIDIFLSKTQRKTPTVIHPTYHITRIRSFYIRKSKLQQILSQFPKINQVHPFYSDLFNVLYDKDHYKLALGHIKSTKSLIQNIENDYLKLMKYGDSLYRCKMLKKAALGRMCTILKKINSSLAYLQQVRKHMGRLPSINPYQKTIIIAGYPNVGKSSYINLITKANVDVQPYPFTTQALYVGHLFQVIDTPGVFDHPLEQMNTIQMQSITAMAHLKACVLFFVDVSQQCGHSILKQLNLLRSLKPLFNKKSILIALNKTDMMSYQGLQQNDRIIINTCAQEFNAQVQGVQKLKQVACNKILESKLQGTIDNSHGFTHLKIQDKYLSGIYIATPKKRDNKQRPVCIPENLHQKQKKPTLKDYEQQNGGAGVFNFPDQQNFILQNDFWKYDKVPQIYNGKNVSDFIDPDILQRLNELEREEELLQQMKSNPMQDEEENDFNIEMQKEMKNIKKKKNDFRDQHKMKKNKRAYKRNFNLSQVKQKLNNLSIDTSLLEKRVHQKSVSKSQRIKNRMELQSDDQSPHKKYKAKLKQISRSRSRGYKRQISIEDKKQVKERNKMSAKWRTKSKISQSDRVIPCKMPKHLFSGKRKLGTTDRR